MWIKFVFLLLIVDAEIYQISGNVFPSFVSPLVGQEVMLRLLQTAEDQTFCRVISNQLIKHTFSTQDKQNAQTHGRVKITYWGGAADGKSCGVRIRNIRESDYGEWRLISHNASGMMYEGTTNISKPDARSSTTEKTVLVSMEEEYVLDFEDLVLSDGLTPKYCVLLRPSGQLFYETFSPSCKAVLPAVTKRDLGTWKAFVGVEGSTEELIYRYSLQEIDRSLKFGIWPSNTTNKNAINLYCNLQDEDVTLKVCRFIRPGDKAGLNMVDHYGDGNYSYFGHGLAEGECGVTLENPGKLDNGTWRCLLYTEQYGTHITIQADIELSRTSIKSATSLPTEPLYVLVNTSGTVTCSANTILEFCTVLLPRGEELMGSPEGLPIGQCSVQVEKFTTDHTGTWTCFMTSNYGARDLQATVQVNVLESPLTAIEHSLTAQLGSPLNLTCRLVAESPSISHCRFVGPDGTGYNLDKTTDLILGRYKYSGRGLAYGECGLLIENVHTTDSGNWTCSISAQMDQQEVSDTIHVAVYGTTNMFPSSLTVDQRTDAVLSMTKMSKNQKNCSVEMPDGLIVYLNDSSSRPVSYWGAGIDLGECGVKISISSLNTTKYRLNEFHTWKLISVGDDDETETAIGWLKVTDEERVIEQRYTTLQVELDHDAEVSCDSEGTDYCVLIPPGADARHVMPGACTMSLKPVKREDLGNWTCVMGVSFSTREVNHIISLLTKSIDLSIGIDNSSSSKVRLYCNTVQAIDFCRFVSPNNSVFVLNDGLVTGRYSSWGKGLAAGHCGIAITGPDREDDGLWKCFVGSKTGNIQSGYIIFSTNELNPWTMADEEVYATRGSSLTLLSKVGASLLYCWYQHPNGSSMVVAAGAGHAVGECKLVLADVQSSDSGTWTCHMGIQSTAGEELVVNTNVIITETTFFSNTSEVQADSNSTVTLLCRSVSTGALLQYCRWVRPDGKDLRPDSQSGQPVEERYWYAGIGLDGGECGIRVAGVAAQDYGTWTCAAWIEGQDKEVRASLKVSQVPEPVTSFGFSVGLGIGIAVGVGAFVMVIIIVKKRRTPSVTVTVDMAELQERRQSTTNSTSSSSPDVLGVSIDGCRL